MSTPSSPCKPINILSANLSRKSNEFLDDGLPFNLDNNLSSSEIKRLFYIWFNSISSDFHSLNISQFSTVLNRIFSSSTTSLTETEIMSIFNTISNGSNDDIIYFNKFLSETDDIFIDIISPYLENDEISISILKSIPNLSINNNNNNNGTLQEILYDSYRSNELLKKWIFEIGLPSQQNKNNLEMELINIESDKSRLNMELKLFEEYKNNLETDKVSISRSYSVLNENYQYSLQQNNDLKVLNEEYKIINDKLQISLNKLEKELNIEKQENIEYKNIINDLTKINEEYKKRNNKLEIKRNEQIKEITNLSSMNNQIEIAMESTAFALELKTEEINKLQQELEILKLNKNNQNTSIFKEYDSNNSNIPSLHNQQNTLRLTQNETLRASQNKVFQNVHKRKSYIFALRTPMDGIPNIHNNISNKPLMFDWRSSGTGGSGTSKQSIISIGGGQPMSFINNTSQQQITNNNNNEYNKLYSDETNGVDVYVFSPNDVDVDGDGDDNEYKIPPFLHNKHSQIKDDDHDEFVMLSDDESNHTLNTQKNNQNEVDVKHAMHLKEIQIKHDLEIMKLKKQLESVKNKKDIFSETPPLPSFRESIEYKMDEDNDNDNDNDDDKGKQEKVPLINKNKKNDTDKIKKNIPREIDENQCVIFGWKIC